MVAHCRVIPYPRAQPAKRASACSRSSSGFVLYFWGSKSCFIEFSKWFSFIPSVEPIHLSIKVLTNLAGGRAKSLMIIPNMEGPMSAHRYGHVSPRVLSRVPTCPVYSAADTNLSRKHQSDAFIAPKFQKKQWGQNLNSVGASGGAIQIQRGANLQKCPKNWLNSQFVGMLPKKEVIFWWRWTFLRWSFKILIIFQHFPPQMWQWGAILFKICYF